MLFCPLHLLWFPVAYVFFSKMMKRGLLDLEVCILPLHQIVWFTRSRVIKGSNKYNFLIEIGEFLFHCKVSYDSDCRGYCPSWPEGCLVSNILCYGYLSYPVKSYVRQTRYIKVEFYHNLTLNKHIHSRVGPRLRQIHQINNICQLCIYIQLKVGLIKFQHS